MNRVNDTNWLMVIHNHFRAWDHDGECWSSIWIIHHEILGWLLRIYFPKKYIRTLYSCLCTVNLTYQTTIGNSYWTDHSSKPMHHEMYVKKNYLIWRFLTDSLKGFFPSTLNSHSFCNYWLDRLEVSIEISFIHLIGTIKWPYQLLKFDFISHREWMNWNSGYDASKGSFDREAS